jgi:polysaccharide biosynthesis transport protein
MSRTAQRAEGGSPQTPYYGYGVGYPPQGGASSQDGLDLKSIFRILYRRKALILACMVVITTLTAALAYQRTPEYTAAAQILVNTRESRVVQQDAVMDRLGRDDLTLETEMRLIRSRAHARQVVDRLALVGDPEFNAELREPEESLVAELFGQPLVWLASQLPDEWLIASGLADQLNNNNNVEEPRSPEDVRESVVRRYLSGLEIARDGNSYLINVAYTSPDPHKAANLANAAAEAYVMAQLDAKRHATRQAYGWLEQRVEELREQVEDAERSVERFRADHGLIAAQGATLGESELADLNRQLMQARAERSEREAKLRLAREVQARGYGFEAVTEVLTSPVVQGLRRDEAALVREEAQVSLELGDRHPRIIQLRAEIDNIRSKIAAEMQTIVNNLENEVRVVGSREQSLQASLDEARGTSADTRQAEVQLREHERRAENTRALYETYLARLTELQDQEELIEGDVQLAAEASAPRSPSTLAPSRITAGGLTVSLLLGIALALLIDRLDSGVRNARQIERLLGVPCFGLVPRLTRLGRNGKPHRYLQEKPLSAYAEGVRGVLTALQLSDVDNPPKVVMVTSTLPGEGKTTMAMSLAASAARASMRTILVDLDLRHPSVHRQLEIGPGAGVVELMAGEASLEEAIVVDPWTPELHYLLVKRQTASPTELISSQRMRTLLADLRRRYDFVVIDTTPALGISDAKVASRLADKVVFVVRWGKTNEEVVVNGLDALDDAQADIAGAVLAQVDIKRHARYGYGDVGQYYGKYKKYYVE